MSTPGRPEAAHERACTLDCIRPGKGTPAGHGPAHSAREEHAANQRERGKAHHYRRESTSRREIGAGHGTHELARAAQEGEFAQEHEGEQDERGGQAWQRWASPSCGQGSSSATAEQPDSEAQKIDQLDAEEGDAQLAEQHELSDDRHAPGGQQGESKREPAVRPGPSRRHSPSWKTSASKTDNSAPLFQQPTLIPPFSHKWSSS